MSNPFLTIGMPTYDDYDGIYFTVNALRMYHDMTSTELLVVDNFGCERTRKFCERADARYVLSKDIVGTAAAKNEVFQHAKGTFVLCMDCHILLDTDSLHRTRMFISTGSATRDLYHGVLVYDDLTTLSTHMNPVWSGGMWGKWGYDKRGASINDDKFPIWGHGGGLVLCRRDAWPGYPAEMRGFGGEEGYIQEKFRQLGREVYCLPWLRWVHRFHDQISPVKYPLCVDDKFRNYVIGFTDLKLPLEPLVSHFMEFMKPQQLVQIASNVLNKKVRLKLEVEIDES